MKLSGASAIVTGGASGLGAATVRRLVAGGAKVVIVDRDEARGAALAARARRGASPRPTSPTPAQVEAAIAAARELGPLRVAVTCAGVGWAARTLDKTGKPHDLELFQTVDRRSTSSARSTCCASRPPRWRRPSRSTHGERGVIVNTASVAAFDGQIGQIAYAASKAGVVGMTLPAARDLAPVGIRVVHHRARHLRHADARRAARGQARRARRRRPVPEAPRRSPAEYAALVAAIVDNGYLNGETIRLDGALRMPPK